MGSSRGRPVWLACGLTAVVLSLAGCVNMPDSGPPSAATVNQNDVGQNQAYDGPVPSPPKPGWSPEEIVEGFLFANSSYYTAGATAAAYLTSQASRTWRPGGSVVVFQNWDMSPDSPPKPGAKQAMVTVSGQVQAALNGSGQQLAAVAQNDSTQQQASPRGAASCAQPDGSYAFTLAKQAGQWRISRAPNCLLLDEDDFQRFWKSQDLYFMDSPQNVLVPDSVFVPIGTSETDLLNRLTDALEAGPSASWLAHGVSANVFPQAKINVTADGTTAIVNLEGHIGVSSPVLKEMSAELVWTLTSASVGQPAIQSVDLEINGNEVFPLGPQQQLDPSSFATYDPYPASAQARFSFVDGNGLPQSACGSAENDGIAPAVPVFTHGTAMTLASCRRSTSPAASPTTTTTTSPSATHTSKPGHGAKITTPAYAMVAVSPDGKKVALVSGNHEELSIGTVGGNTALKPVSGVSKTPITSISWDRQDDLWFTQDGGVWMVAPNGKAAEAGFGEDVTALTVAPDGVRAALIVQQGVQQVLELAALNPAGNATAQPSPHGNEVSPPAIGQPVPLGPGVTGARAVTWYDTDDLIVLAPDDSTSQLEEVPVNGRAATQPLAPVPTPSGVTVVSIAAGNADSVVVAGLSNGQLEVSAGFEGPWQNAGAGSEPSYWIPPSTNTSASQ